MAKYRILETERLYLRELCQEDFPALCMILQDEKTMYAYEGAFSDTEVQQWLDRQFSRYREFGFGLWAAVRNGMTAADRWTKHYRGVDMPHIRYVVQPPLEQEKRR